MSVSAFSRFPSHVVLVFTLFFFLVQLCVGGGLVCGQVAGRLRPHALPTRISVESEDRREGFFLAEFVLFQFCRARDVLRMVFAPTPFKVTTYSLD